MDKVFGMFGDDAKAKVAGEMVGEFVGDAVEKMMSGGEKKEGEEKGEGLNIGNVLSAVGGGSDKKDDGFDVGDALKMVTGNKDGEGDGVKSLFGAFK